MHGKIHSANCKLIGWMRLLGRALAEHQVLSATVTGQTLFSLTDARRPVEVRHLAFRLCDEGYSSGIKLARRDSGAASDVFLQRFQEYTIPVLYSPLVEIVKPESRLPAAMCVLAHSYQSL